MGISGGVVRAGLGGFGSFNKAFSQRPLVLTNRGPFVFGLERVDFEVIAVDALGEIDLSLFGLRDAENALPDDARREADRLLLELKSADAAAGAEEQRALLAEMMREMRAQFIAFRDIRARAAELCDEGDDAAQKLARADLKAAADAMKLIVGTLEKVDSLQRQLVRDREAEEERQAEEGGYREALHEVQKLIEDRASELFEEWKCAERAGHGEGGAAGAGQPSACAEGEGGCAGLRDGHGADSG